MLSSNMLIGLIAVVAAAPVNDGPSGPTLVLRETKALPDVEGTLAKRFNLAALIQAAAAYDLTKPATLTALLSALLG
jgi:hypothetical protein